MSGWVDSEISLAPLFELRPVHGGDSIFVDTGVTPVQGFPMGLTSDSSRWTRVPMTSQTVGWTDMGESLYYPGSVLILAKEQGVADKTELARVKALLSRAALPDGHPEKVHDVTRELPGYISMCAKQSADHTIY